MLFFIFSSYFGKKSFDRIRRHHVICTSHLPCRMLKLLNRETSQILCHITWCHYLGNTDYWEQTNKSNYFILSQWPVVQKLSWALSSTELNALNADGYASAAVSVNLPVFACSHEVSLRAKPLSSPSYQNENHVLLWAGFSILLKVILHYLI